MANRFGCRATCSCCGDLFLINIDYHHSHVHFTPAFHVEIRENCQHFPMNGTILTLFIIAFIVATTGNTIEQPDEAASSFDGPVLTVEKEESVHQHTAQNEDGNSVVESGHFWGVKFIYFF